MSHSATNWQRKEKLYSFNWEEVKIKGFIGESDEELMRCVFRELAIRGAI